MSVLFENMTERMDNLEKKLDDEAQTVNEEITTVHTQFSKSLLEVKSEMQNGIRLLNEKIDAVNINTRKSVEISLSGIPESEGEDLKVAIFKISSLIMYEDLEAIVDISRLKPVQQQSSSGSIGNVIVRFTTMHSRRLFLSKYFAFITTCQLKLTHIGINSQSRIFINENSSKECLDLLKKAKMMKQAGKIAGVHLHDGQVRVFRQRNDKISEIISNVDDLKKYEWHL